MAPSSKPPSSHQSRPPLASRIRASFELKRSKSTNKGHSRSESHSEDLASPTAESNGSPIIANGFLSGPGGQDGDTLRSAVDQAINSDAFQGAIAAHLAKLIKPSIKSALDTIQPLVEAVYTHELLLRKTNQNVENALERMETNTNTSRRVSRIDPDDGGEAVEHLQLPEEAPATREINAGGTSPDLDHFKQLLQESNARTAATIAGLSGSIEASNTKIGEVAEGIAEIKGSLGPGIESLKTTSEESNTTFSSLQAQLDQLKTDVAQILEAIGADLGKNVQAIHERGVPEPNTSFLSEHTTKLDAISTDLAALKGHGDTVEKIDAISTELAALKGSVEGGIVSNSEGFTGLGAQITNVLSVIEGHRASDPSAEILAAVHKSNESHASHAAALDGMKSIGGESPDLSGLGPQITTMISTLENHTAALEEIKTSSGSHAAALEGHGAALQSIRSVDAGVIPASSDNSADLEPHVTSMITTLEAHSAILEELKGASSAHSAALEAHGTSLDAVKSASAGLEPTVSTVDLAPLEAQVTAIATTLETHSAVLDEIKSTGTSHMTALESHGTALEGMRSISGGDASAPQESNLTGLEAQITAVIGTLQTHSSFLEELKGTTSSHATAFAERSIESPQEPGSFSELESKIGSLASTLETHGSVLDEIKMAGGSHSSMLDEIKTAHSSHASALEEIKSTTLEHGSLLEEIRSPGFPPVAHMGTGMGMPDTSNLAALEIQIGSIINTLSTHTSALADIGTRVGASNATNLSSDSENPSGDLNTVIEILDAHTAMLNEIKEDVSAEILTALHNIDQKQENCANLLIEVREGDVSEEVLTLLHGVGETANGHTTDLQGLRDAIQTSHGALEEIKSRDLAPSEVAAPAHVDLSPLEAQIASLHTVLEDHRTTLSGIKDATTASHDLHIAHGSSLEEIKTRSLEPAPAAEIAVPSFEGIESKLDNLIASLDEHKSTLFTIKDTTSASQELHTSHAVVLDELKSRSIEPAPAAAVPNFEGMEGKIDGLISSLEDHRATLSAIKETTDASHEMHASHTASLDEIKSRSVEPAQAAEVPDFSGIETQLGGIVASLEEHKTALSAIQESHGAHAASLDEIKSRSIESAPAMEAPDFSGLESQIGGVVASLEEHKTILSRIQESHEIQVASLDQMKARSVDPDHISGILAGLDEHKASLATIQEKTIASHDLHVAHAGSLDEMKSRSIDSPAEDQPVVNIEGLEAQIGGIISSLEEQKSILSELKDTTSGFAETHVAHANLLNEIKEGTALSNESHGSHAVILDELKAIPAPASPDLSAIEAHLNSIISTLESQTETLSSIKEDNANSEVHEAVKQSHELLTTNHEVLTSHTALLSDIKASSSSDEMSSSLSEIKSILVESKSGIDSHGDLVKDLHSSTKDSHSNLTTAIAALALGGAAGAGTTALLSHNDDDSSDEVLAEVRAIRGIVEGTKEDVGSMRSQLDINHTTVTTSLSSLAEEIKAEIDASGTHINESVIAVHDDVKAIDLSPVHAALEQHGTEVRGLATQLEGIDGNVKAIDLTPVHASLEQHGNDVKGLATQLESIDGGVKAIDLAPVHAALEQHGSDVQNLSAHVENLDLAPLHAALELHGAGIDGIYNQLETLDGNVKDTTSHVQALHDGVHLNDTGVQQLESRAVSRQVASAPMSEGAWFKRDKSLSPVLEMKSPLGEDEEHSSMPGVLAGVVAGGALLGGAAALLSRDDDSDHEEVLPTTESDEQDRDIGLQDESQADEAALPESEADPSPAVEKEPTVVESVEEDQLPEDHSPEEPIELVQSEDADEEDHDESSFHEKASELVQSEDGGEDAQPDLDPESIDAEPVEPQLEPEAARDIEIDDDALPTAGAEATELPSADEPLEVDELLESEAAKDIETADDTTPDSIESTEPALEEPLEESQQLETESIEESEGGQEAILEESSVEPELDIHEEENETSELEHSEIQDAATNEDNTSPDDIMGSPNVATSEPLEEVQDTELEPLEVLEPELSTAESSKEVEDSDDTAPEVSTEPFEPVDVEAAEDSEEPEQDVDELDKEIKESDDVLPDDSHEILEAPTLVEDGSIQETDDEPLKAIDTEPQDTDDSEVIEAPQTPIDNIEEPQVEAESESEEAEPVAVVQGSEEEDDNVESSEPIIDQPHESELAKDVHEIEAAPPSEDIEESKEIDLEPELSADESENKLEDVSQDHVPSDEIQDELEDQSDPSPAKAESLHDVEEESQDEIPAGSKSLAEDEGLDSDLEPSILQPDSDEKVEDDREDSPIADDLVSSPDETANIQDDSVVAHEEVPSVTEEDDFEDSPAVIKTSAEEDTAVPKDPESEDELFDGKDEEIEQPSHLVVDEEASAGDPSDTEEEAPRIDAEDSPEADDMETRSETLEKSESGDVAESSSVIEESHSGPAVTEDFEDKDITTQDISQDGDSAQDEPGVQEEDDVRSESTHSDAEAPKHLVTEPHSEAVEEPINLDEELSVHDDSEDDDNSGKTVLHHDEQDSTHSPMPEEEEIVRIQDDEEHIPTNSDEIESSSETSEHIREVEDHTQSKDDEEQFDSDEEKPEGALSPILESSLDNSPVTGVEDPFSDAQISDSLPSHPQVQTLSYTSPLFTLSHMSESHPLEHQLRETASSQLGNSREMMSPGFDSQGLVSSPFITQPQDSSFAFKEERSSPPRAYSPSQELSSPYQQSPQQSISDPILVDEQEIEEDLDSRPASQVDQYLPPFSEHSTAVHTSEADLPADQHQQKLSRTTSASSGSAFDPYSPRPSSPAEQQIHHPISTDGIFDIDRQSEEAAYEHELPQEHVHERSLSDTQQPFNAVARDTEGYSRRSTMENHAAPTSAPGAGYYAPSATESHYSISEHPDAAPEADPFAPTYDSYSPTDVVNDYADYTPSAYDQTPVGEGRAEYFEGRPAGNIPTGQNRFDIDDEDLDLPAVSSPTEDFASLNRTENQSSVQRGISPPRSFPRPAPRPQYSGELSPIDQQYMQRGVHEPEFDVQARSAQYARYTEERSPTEPSPYSQEGLLDRDYDTAPLPAHRAQYTGDNSSISLNERLHERYDSPEPQYIAPRDEQYMQDQAQGQRQQYVPSPTTPAFGSRYEEDQESPPDTGHFQEQFGSRNPFAAPATQANFAALSPGRGYGQDFASPTSNSDWNTGRFTDDADAAHVAQSYLPRELPPRGYEEDLLSPRSNDRFLDDADLEQRYLPRELPQSGYGGFGDGDQGRGTRDAGWGDEPSALPSARRGDYEEEDDTESPTTARHQERSSGSRER